MNRSDTLRSISAHCRRSHSASLWALGYLLMELDTETLESLLEGLSELDAVHSPLFPHLTVVQERWGGSTPRR